MVRDAARDVVDAVVRDGEVHPVFGRSIIESDERITATTVTAEGDFYGETPGALGLKERTGMTATAAGRSGDWLCSHRRDDAPGGRRARREGPKRAHDTCGRRYWTDDLRRWALGSGPPAATFPAL